MKNKLKLIIAVIVVIMIGVSGKALLKSRQGDIKNAPKPINMAQTTLLYEPSNEQIIKQEGFLATIKPQKEVLTSAKIPGFINKIYVKENQVVKKGDILVSI